MKCTKCGLRDATAEVLVRHNDRVEKMYLCRECVKEYSPEMNFNGFDMLNKVISGSPMGLLSNITGMFNVPTARGLVCPECKTTSDEFLKTGFVGCPHCYEAFEPLIAQTVKKLQQSDRHTGKIPFGNDPAGEEARLKAELQDAVDKGDYSKIGELGDKLKRIVANRNEGK